MDTQELLTAPASTLTRKQRRDRAALKRQLAAAMQVPEGYMLGRVRVPDPLPGIEQTVYDPPEPLIRRAVEQGKLPGAGAHVTMVRMLDQQPAVGRP
jgi:hypothetical protein